MLKKSSNLRLDVSGRSLGLAELCARHLPTFTHWKRVGVAKLTARRKDADKRSKKWLRVFRRRKFHKAVANAFQFGSKHKERNIPALEAVPSMVVEKRISSPKQEEETDDVEIEEPKGPTAPAIDDDLSEKIFAPTEKKAEAEPSSHAFDDSVESLVALKNEGRSALDGSAPRQNMRGGGFGVFWKSLFARPKTRPSSPLFREEAPPAEVTKKKEPVDLDALLQSDKPTAALAPKEERALPREDLLTDESQKDETLVRRANVLEQKTAMVPEKQEPATTKTNVTIELTPVVEKKPDAAPAATAATSQEIVYKPKPVHRMGMFSEFLGAVKYIGLGGERQSIIQNLATMLNAGLPLIDSLKTLQLETRQKPIKKLLGRILELVENGSPLWRAMEDQSFFTPHAIALIRIGEEAGNLAENMEYLSAQQEKDAALKAKVKMAMIYPTIVMVLMFIIVIGMGMFVLPNLVSVLFSLNVELPLVTRIIIKFTEFFTTHGKVAVPSFVVGFLLFFILAKFTPLRVATQWVMFRIPGIGRLAREATIARFGVILGGLMQAGVPLTDALRSMAEVTPIAAYKRFYERMLERITLGDSFAKTFSMLRGSEKLLPVSVQQLVITGEKSGSLAKILLKIAEIYEKKANNTAEKLPVILEPIILLIIGGMVGTIAFAIIVPIYSIVGNVAN